MTEENISCPEPEYGCSEYSTCNSPIKNETSCKEGLTYLAYKSLGVCGSSKLKGDNKQ